jgi:hypothetical protein
VNKKFKMVACNAMGVCVEFLCESLYSITTLVWKCRVCLTVLECNNERVVNAIDLVPTVESTHKSRALLREEMYSEFQWLTLKNSCILAWNFVLFLSHKIELVQ